MKRIFGCAIVLLTLGGCADLPRDQRNTTQQIRQNHVLIAGISGDAENKTLAAREKQLIEKVARKLGARVQWKEGNAHQLLEALEDAEFAVVAAQVPSDTPFAERVGLSQPYWKDGPRQKDYCLAVAPGENKLLLLIDQTIAEQKPREGSEAP